MTTIRDILPLVETGYRNNGLRSLSSLHNNARHVNDALGDRRAESITSMDISWCVQHRLNQGAANASIANW